MSLSALYPFAPLSSLLGRVDPLSLRTIAIELEKGKRGRAIDYLVHCSLIDHKGGLDGWRYRRAGGDTLAVQVRRGRGPDRLVAGVLHYTTSKDALDPVVRMLVPEASITSSFGAGRSRIIAETTYASRRGEAYMTKAVVPVSNDPAAEASARCAAILRLLADIATERRRFADERSEDRARKPLKQKPAKRKRS